MEGYSHWIKIDLRHRLMLEMPISVFAAHQSGAVPVGQNLACLGRNITQDDTDTPVVAFIGMGRVRDRVIEERGFARLQFDIHSQALIDIHDRLTSGQHVVLGPRIDMRHRRLQMAARQHPHAAALDGRR